MVIDGNYLFIGLLMLALCLTVFAANRPNILLAFCASLIWFSTGMLLWFSSVPLFGLTENWSKVLVWVFGIMSFVPFLLQMDTEIKNDRPGVSWTEWGDKPKAKQIDAGTKYQIELSKRLGKARRR